MQPFHPHNLRHNPNLSFNLRWLSNPSSNTQTLLNRPCT